MKARLCAELAEARSGILSAATSLRSAVDPRARWRGMVLAPLRQGAADHPWYLTSGALLLGFLCARRIGGFRRGPRHARGAEYQAPSLAPARSLGHHLKDLAFSSASGALKPVLRDALSSYIQNRLARGGAQRPPTR